MSWMQDRHAERVKRSPCRSLSILDALTSDSDPTSVNKQFIDYFHEK